MVITRQVVKAIKVADTAQDMQAHLVATSTEATTVAAGLATTDIRACRSDFDCKCLFYGVTSLKPDRLSVSSEKAAAVTRCWLLGMRNVYLLGLTRCKQATISEKHGSDVHNGISKHAPDCILVL